MRNVLPVVMLTIVMLFAGCSESNTVTSEIKPIESQVLPMTDAQKAEYVKWHEVYPQEDSQLYYNTALLLKFIDQHGTVINQNRAFIGSIISDKDPNSLASMVVVNKRVIENIVKQNKVLSNRIDRLDTEILSIRNSVMAKKTYGALQGEAKLLGIPANSDAEALAAAIEEATSVPAVVALIEAKVDAEDLLKELQDKNDADTTTTDLQTKIEELTTTVDEQRTSIETANESKVDVEALEEQVKDLTDKLEAAKAAPTEIAPVDPDTILGKLRILHETTLEDRNVHSDPSLAGVSNGILIAIAEITGEDISEKLIKSVAGIIGELTPKTNRERLVKALGLYVATGGGLRTGLQDGDDKKADEILKALGEEPGVYKIPVA